MKFQGSRILSLRNAQKLLHILLLRNHRHWRSRRNAVLILAQPTTIEMKEAISPVRRKALVGIMTPVPQLARGK